VPKPYRLKVPTGWLPLAPGDFEIGRSAHCQVILDGPKVSRLHARIVVDANGASVEDLGSANGVFVNGRRVVRGRHAIEPGDRILVGDFELELSLGDAVETMPPDRMPSGRPTLVDSLPSPGAGAATSKAHALELLGSVAERAIGTGDAARAESILKGRLHEVLQAAAAGQCDAVSRELAVKLALSLARAMPSPAWVDFTVDLLSSTRTLPSETEINALESAALRVTGADARKLQDYTTLVRTMPSSLEKVRAMQRLEAVLSTVCGRQ
jgi:hypothetical protein